MLNTSESARSIIDQTIIYTPILLLILSMVYFYISLQVEPTATVLDIKALFHKSCE